MKLKEYGLAAAAILASGDVSNQTAMYQDIDPDINIPAGDPFGWFYSIANIDLNHDGVDDFRFRLEGFTTYTGWDAVGSFIQAAAIPLGSNQVQIASSQYIGWCSIGWNAANFANVANYSNGQMIHANPTAGSFIEPINEEQSHQNLFIQRVKGYFASSWSYFGDCDNPEDFYMFTGGFWFHADSRVIPFKVKDGGNLYTGWIRLSVDEGSLNIEDYAISMSPEANIVAGSLTGTVTAQAPNPGLVTVATTKANLTWSSVPGAIKYRFRYRPVGATVWITKMTTTTSKLIKSLTCGTAYEWQVQAVYDNTPALNSEWSDVVNFSTSSCRIGDENTYVEDVIVYPIPASNSITIETVSPAET
ncbi:MAG TPA: fibronectin type III domain-containing protein, partial [Chitinophagales bacterium]|nr:fibronectin type III domain-containing protein [Chitinophagales bacterium]